MGSTKETADLKRKLRAGKKAAKQHPRLSSGCVLVNLACSGHIDWAFQCGGYYLAVGASQSGKTWIGLQTLAEAAANPAFKDYLLIYDQPERGAKMSMPKYFGKRLASRLQEPPGGGPSTTVEQLYRRLDQLHREGQPFIYLLDSEDGLTSEAADKKFRKKANAAARGEDSSGSYGMDKAKAHSSSLGRVMDQLDKTGSLLLMIKQRRVRIGFGAVFDPWTKSGGEAITFYATEELWFSIREKIKDKIHGVNRRIGTRLRVHVKKNRVSGRERSIDLDHYYTCGIDDTGSCINWLIAEKHWQGSEHKVSAPEFEYDGSIAGLVQLVEQQNQEDKLHELVADVWEEIEAACAVSRKRRYE